MPIPRVNACDNLDAPFSESNDALTNPDATMQEPSCNDWENGLTCTTTNIIGKLNWLFNNLNKCVDDIDERLQAVLHQKMRETGIEPRQSLH